MTSLHCYLLDSGRSSFCDPPTDIPKDYCIFGMKVASFFSFSSSSSSF